MKEYLESREKEVVDIMMTLFDNEYILKTYVEEEKKAAAAAAAEEAEMRRAKETVLNLADMGLPVEQIAKAVKVSVSVVKQWIEGNVSLAK